MKVRYLHEFLVEFEALDKGVQKQIRKKLDGLYRVESSSFLHQPLRGKQFKGLYKLRAGDWRLIYQIVSDECVFITLGHRSEVYR